MVYIKEGLKRGLIGILCGLSLMVTLILLNLEGTGTLSLDGGLFIEQYVIYGLSGFYFSALSVVFNIEEWSVLRQVVIHVLATLPFLPLAYWLGLMPRTGFGMGIFVGIYLSCYGLSFIIYKLHLIKEAKAINQALKS